MSNSAPSYFADYTAFREEGGISFQGCFDHEIAHITELMRRGQPAVATLCELESFKQKLNDFLQKVSAQIDGLMAQNHEALIEILMLRQQLVEGAKCFAIVTDDTEGEAKMDECLRQMDSDIFESIADLDPDTGPAA